MLLDGFERGGAVIGGHYLVALIGQDPLQGLADLGVVFGHQDALGLLGKAHWGLH